MSSAIAKEIETLRAGVPHLDHDRYLAPDIAAATELVRSGALAAAAGLALPSIDPGTVA